MLAWLCAPLRNCKGPMYTLKPSSSQMWGLVNMSNFWRFSSCLPSKTWRLWSVHAKDIKAPWCSKPASESGLLLPWAHATCRRTGLHFVFGNFLPAFVHEGFSNFVCVCEPLGILWSCSVPSEQFFPFFNGLTSGCNCCTCLLNQSALSTVEICGSLVFNRLKQLARAAQCFSPVGLRERNQLFNFPGKLFVFKPRATGITTDMLTSHSHFLQLRPEAADKNTKRALMIHF